MVHHHGRSGDDTLALLIKSEPRKRKSKRNYCVCLCVFALLAINCSPNRTASATISLNPSIKYQTMAGWEAAILGTVLDYRTHKTPAFNTLLEQAVDDLGMTRLQLGVYAGMEHPFDSAPGYLSGAISERDWRKKYLFDSVNDNADPEVINPNGFQWTTLDWEIDNLVLRIKRRVEARGEKLYAYVSYTDYGSSPFEHWQNPPEYAEFMLALFEHMQTKYGFVPDGINVINEPGYHNDWTAAAIGKVIAATGQRLASAGYHPDFLAPSTVDMGQAPAFFDAIVAVPGASQYLKEITYHRYDQSGGVGRLKQIADRAEQHGIRTAMNEWWTPKNTYRTLHEDLKIGRNSAWQQAAIGGQNGYHSIDSNTGQVSITSKTKLMRQYYKYIRPGAQRIEAVTSDSALDPLAFINKDGGYVIVIKAELAGTFSVTNLPGGTYGISYTTDTEFDVNLPDVLLTNGQTLGGRIPAIGVITIRLKS